MNGKYKINGVGSQSTYIADDEDDNGVGDRQKSNNGVPHKQIDTQKTKKLGKRGPAPQGPVMCERCEKNWPNKSRKERHEKETKGNCKKIIKYRDKAGRYTCTLCEPEKVLATNQSLICHLKFQHTNEEVVNSKYDIEGYTNCYYKASLQDAYKKKKQSVFGNQTGVQLIADDEDQFEIEQQIEDENNKLLPSYYSTYCDTHEMLSQQEFLGNANQVTGFRILENTSDCNSQEIIQGSQLSYLSLGDIEQELKEQK